MKILSWVQSKFSGRREQKRRAAALSCASCASVPVISNEEFRDWSQALLAIGTLGNRDIQEEDPQGHESLENLQASEDLPDFTMEEVDRFQVELVKLLTRKPNSSTGAPQIAEADPANPLPNRFLDPPWSLEVDGKPENLENDNHGDLSPSTKIILSQVRDALSSNRTAIKKESLSFLFKKMFVCGSGFAPPRNLKDPIPEPRIDKTLRAILAKKIYPQSPALAPAKKYLENKPTEKLQEEEDKRKDQYKWVKTDSECNYRTYCSGDLETNPSRQSRKDPRHNPSLISNADSKWMIGEDELKLKRQGGTEQNHEFSAIEVVKNNSESKGANHLSRTGEALNLLTRVLMPKSDSTV